MIGLPASKSLRRRLPFACALIFACAIRAPAQEPTGTPVRPGATVSLLKAWPEIAKAPKEKLATLEFLVRPDAAAIARPRSFIMTLSNQAGRDAAGLSITLQNGTVAGHVFGTALIAPRQLEPNRWTHVALTVNTKTINKQAALWIDGKRVSEELVLEYWPQSFEVAELLSDKWNLGRVFSGSIGDVRISSVVRYREDFNPPSSLPRDDFCSFHLAGNRIPIQ